MLPSSPLPSVFFMYVSLPVSWLLRSGAQSVGASTSVLPVIIQDQFSLWLTGLISLLSRGLWGVFSNTKFKNINSLAFGLLSGPTLTSIREYYKNRSLDYTDFVGKVMSLLFNTLSRFVIAFLPRSKCLLISWLQSLPSVMLEAKKIKSVTVQLSSSICQEVMRPNAMVLVFWMLRFKLFFTLSPSSRGSLVPLHFLPLEYYHLHIYNIVDISSGSLNSSLLLIQHSILLDVLCI